MNIAEIELDLKELVEQPFDSNNFLFRLLEIYDAPKATVTKLRQGSANQAKHAGDVLWKNKIFFRVSGKGRAAVTVDAMAADPLAQRHKPRLIFATDGVEVYCRDTKADQSIDVAFSKLNDNFDFFLPLAGIERYEGVAESQADIKATGRLAKLYDAILEANPEWIGRNHTHELDLFMTRLLFCFFAENTSIFEKRLFSSTLFSLIQDSGSNAVQVLGTVFLAMNTPEQSREALPEYARRFPYVNGGLFRDKTPIPKFSKRARRLLKECGDLNWSEINPDIFGSMIQAIVEPEMRGDMGMHYTSVPNIMKVLQPLFLLSLEEEFEAARESEPKLKKLLDRIYHIRVFDPACGSGNFLIIAYREMRKLETRIFQRLREVAKQFSLPMTGVHLSQFFGIELADFACETAKLSLWIAEYQMNEQFKAVFGMAPPALPLKDSGNIVQGNAAKKDWTKVCPIENGRETYIVGNPPFEGARGQSTNQKADIAFALGSAFSGSNSLDYVCIWFYLAAKYINASQAQAAFVATSSICQGQSISLFWARLIAQSVEIGFAHAPFKWRNNAIKNAAVNCVIVGVRAPSSQRKLLYDGNASKVVPNISPYLTANENIIVEKRFQPPEGIPPLVMGNQAIDGGHLILTPSEAKSLLSVAPNASQYIRPVYGANDFVQSESRFCIWVAESSRAQAEKIPELRERFERVRKYRQESGEVARSLVHIPYRFRYIHEAKEFSIVVPRTTTAKREYIACGILPREAIVTDAIQIIYDPEMYMFSIISSRMHMIWLKAVGGKFKTDPRYSNTLVYNTFPLPRLSDAQKVELESDAFAVLGAREAHPGKTLGWLYDPETMPSNLLNAHHKLDDAVERIYGRTFKSDVERLEHLFKLYAATIKKNEGVKAQKKGAA